MKRSYGNLLRRAIVLSLVLFGCGESRVDYPQRQMPEGLLREAAQLSAGYTLFHDKCASCHGKLSEGRSDRAVFFDPPAPDFTNINDPKTDPAYLYWRIESGKNVEPYRSQGSVMPAWGGYLTEQQIWQLVAYLQSRGP